MMSPLVMADNAPVCGESLGAIGVDTGLASIVTATGNRALNGLFEQLEARGSDLYDALSSQLPLRGLPTIVTLPDGTQVPTSRSGHGDGGYEFFRLDDVQGQTVAYFLDFLGDSKGEWIDPPPCANV